METGAAYNRQKRRAIRKEIERRKRRKDMPRQERKQVDMTEPDVAQIILEGLNVHALVAGINNTLEVLERRGVVPKDYDRRDCGLYRLKVIRGDVYYLVDVPDEGADIE